MLVIYNAFWCMSSKVFVGGILYGVGDQTLSESFATFGNVMEAKNINDRETRRSRGFGFVTFASLEEANVTVEAMDGKDLQVHSIHVNIAQERAFGGGGGRGFSGDSGNGWRCWCSQWKLICPPLLVVPYFDVLSTMPLY